MPASHSNQSSGHHHHHHTATSQGQIGPDGKRLPPGVRVHSLPPVGSTPHYDGPARPTFLNLASQIDARNV